MAGRKPLHIADLETPKRLEKERERLGLPKNAFAERIGVSPQRYGQWLGNRGFPRQYAKNVAERLRWSIDRLLGTNTAAAAEQTPAPYTVEPELQRRLIAAIAWLTDDQRISLVDSVEYEAAHNRDLIEQLRETSPAAKLATSENPAPYTARPAKPRKRSKAT